MKLRLTTSLSFSVSTQEDGAKHARKDNQQRSYRGRLLIEMEPNIAFGLPTFMTAGLPEGTVRESKDRVKTAIKNSGYEFPNRRITVNLAPADVKKSGTGYDLPMALGILAASDTLWNPRGRCVVYLSTKILSREKTLQKQLAVSILIVFFNVRFDMHPRRPTKSNIKRHFKK